VLKRWKYLDHILPDSQVPFFWDILRIVFALSNKYLPGLSQSLESDDAEAQYMLQLSSNSNALQEEIVSCGLEKRRAIWEPVEVAGINVFPDSLKKNYEPSPVGYKSWKLAQGTYKNIYKEMPRYPQRWPWANEGPPSKSPCVSQAVYPVAALWKLTVDGLVLQV